ncbi:zinc-ribbon domain-containing protein [Agromyces sp. CF514]|uniref:zinc-ribbon domain-containing protein n=1 Tax=Agromyces sp. CF514 TaxID=1881031 RepID=UPI0008EE21B1|nr:zinc-ribbon domain-containing protein [Agromyces sp. CF514]SFR87395.1 zinc-ribbon domain-containing protein [Agromyces sp. CF514]
MRCRICGAALPDGAMFCGHCGSSTSATPESRRRPDPRPGDTTSLGKGFRRSGVVSVPVGLEIEDPDASTSAEAPAGQPAADALAGSPGSSVDAVAPTDAGAGSGSASEPVAGERTRFVLRFATGEVRVVFGTGLIGRRPLPQPGEAFDHLVHIEDPGRSVSKTHLEFGAHEGTLWVADRFSANGTVIRRADDDVVRCEPGRRYLVGAGAVVELAEQSFTIG